MLQFELPPGNYYIGDPYLFLLPEVVNGYFQGDIGPGFYSHEGFYFIIDCTGFDEGSFHDADRSEYMIYHGLLGIMPIELCQDRGWERLGKKIYYPCPIIVRTNGEGYFEVECCSYKLVLETSLDGFSEESFS